MNFRFQKAILTVLLFVSATLGALTYAHILKAQESNHLTAEDHVEITSLYARFNQGSDFRNADLWLSTFSDDAVFTLPNGQRIVGKDALREWRLKSFGDKTGDSKRRHLHGSIQLTSAANGEARGRAYWLVLDVSDKEPKLASTGFVDDVFVETKEGWRFKTHTVHADATSN